MQRLPATNVRGKGIDLNMKVLSINTSSRKNGNTAYACKVLAEAIAGADGEITHFDICKMAISPCKSCYACEVKGRCVVKDDWQKIHDALWEADALVFGTPVYVLRESAWARIFIERSVSLISHVDGLGKKGKTMYEAMREFKEEHPGEDYGMPSIRLPAGKHLYLIVTQNSPVTYPAEQNMEYLSFIFTIVGCEIKRRWIISDTLESHDLKRRIETDGLPPEVFSNL
jgi:multimeric flavodoxin WrbA